MESCPYILLYTVVEGKGKKPLVGGDGGQPCRGRRNISVVTYAQFLPRATPDSIIQGMALPRAGKSIGPA